jgi:hypothetical protein
MNISSDCRIHFDTDALPERDCFSAVREQFDGQLKIKLRPST